ncbi:hypothetical protein K1719_043090 [Acacia pycnantha]|nr:hypothetical protein K1719_043090 [Acacia pycnantha]
MSNEEEWPKLGQSFAEKLQCINKDEKMGVGSVDANDLSDETLSENDSEKDEDGPLCVIRDNPTEQNIQEKGEMPMRDAKMSDGDVWKDRVDIGELLQHSGTNKGHKEKKQQKEKARESNGKVILRLTSTNSNDEVTPIDDSCALICVEGKSVIPLVTEPPDMDLSFTEPIDPGESLMANIIYWNIRGACSKGLLQHIRPVIKGPRPCMLILFETKCKSEAQLLKLKKLGIDGFVSVLSYGRTGEPSFFLTAVYSLPPPNLKQVLWQELQNLSSSISDPWAILGDFNDISSPSERIGGFSDFELRRVWQKPSSDWIKLNVDGDVMLRSSKAGCGGLLRDSRGTWLCGLMKDIGTCDAYSVEEWVNLQSSDEAIVGGEESAGNSIANERDGGGKAEKERTYKDG